MIANILCVLWTPFRNKRDLTHPKSGSDVKTDNAHTPRKYEKVYYLHNKAFQGKQNKPPRLAWNWLETARRGDWLEVSIVVKGWGWLGISGA